jgi:hypothetical protein
MIDSQWVIGCTHLVRSLFQTHQNLRQVQQVLYQHFSSHGLLAGTKQLPISMAMAAGEASTALNAGGGNGTNANNKASVYRVSKKNFCQYIDGLLRQIGTESVMLSIIASLSQSDAKTPCVYHLSPDAFDLVLFVVESTRPGEPIQVRWFKMIGVSDLGVSTMLQVYDMFCRRSHENDIKKHLRALGNLDFELLHVFFHLLRMHNDQRLIPLDEPTAHEQELSVRHRSGVHRADDPIPAHQAAGVMCSIAGCNEFKNYVVQRTHSPLFTGFPKLAWRQDMLEYICTNKKTILVRERNADRLLLHYRQIGEKPQWLTRLLSGDMSRLYGEFAPVDKLIRLPPGTTNSAEFLELQKFLHMEHSKPLCRKRDTMGRRDNLEHSFSPEILSRISILKKLLQEMGIEPNAHILYSLEYVPKDKLQALSDDQLLELEQARGMLDAECKKEERRIFTLKTRLPCYELPVQMAPLVGYLLEKDSQKNRSTSLVAGICRSCGATYDFTRKLSWANG